MPDESTENLARQKARGLGGKKEGVFGRCLIDDEVVDLLVEAKAKGIDTKKLLKSLIGRVAPAQTVEGSPE